MRCSRRSARPRNFIPSSPSSRSSAPRARRSRSPHSSPRTPSARSRCSRRPASPLSARPRLAQTHSPPSSPGARRGTKSGSEPNLNRALTPNGFEVLASLGIPVAEHAIVQPPDYAHRVPYPVALKRMDVEHKTEMGGVALNIRNDKELREHARRMGGGRLLVQRMESGLAQAIVGYRDDPVVGPLVLVGCGGVLAELYEDVAIAMAPVS